MMEERFIAQVRELLQAKNEGLLGECIMPEDTNPGFKVSEKEARIAYFTLPMALNYQRDSYKLWEAALKTYQDPETKDVFSVAEANRMPTEVLRAKLGKHRLALQPNKHVDTWQRIASTIYENWESCEKFIEAAQGNFLMLRQLVQIDYKKRFPYLSGPKIFNYWSFIIQEYGGVSLLNSSAIEIAPDTHITKCSVRLGLISEKEAESLSREQISLRWREALAGSGIDPIFVHPALWFWSRSGFEYALKS